MKQTHAPRSRECFVGTYPPRECGIATFTYDLRQAICALRPGVSAIEGMGQAAAFEPQDNLEWLDVTEREYYLDPSRTLRHLYQVFLRKHYE